MKTKKAFDCIAVKHAIQSAIYDEIKGMSHEDEIAYFRRNAENGPLKEAYVRLRERSEARPVPVER